MQLIEHTCNSCAKNCFVAPYFDKISKIKGLEWYNDAPAFIAAALKAGLNIAYKSSPAFVKPWHRVPTIDIDSDAFYQFARLVEDTKLNVLPYRHIKHAWQTISWKTSTWRCSHNLSSHSMILAIGSQVNVMRLRANGSLWFIGHKLSAHHRLTAFVTKSSLDDVWSIVALRGRWMHLATRMQGSRRTFSSK